MKIKRREDVKKEKRGGNVNEKRRIKTDGIKSEVYEDWKDE
jgi:hypothetical protein